MDKKTLLLLLQGCALKLAIARLNITLTNSGCGKNYNMEDIGEAYVTYSGARLEQEECIVQFINYRTFTKQTCVTPLRLKLGCSTKVEYYRTYFRITHNLQPKTIFTCGNVTYDEWCGPTRTTWLYILFRTSWGSSEDYVQLHVYLKDLPKEDDPREEDTDTSTTSIGTPLLSVIGAVVFFVIFAMACKLSHTRRMQASERCVYQTTGEQVNLQTTGHGHMNPAQSMPGYPTAQQFQFQPTVEVGYQLHPVQNAYPLPSQTQNGRQSSVGFHVPSAPPNASADPPSYESVSK